MHASHWLLATSLAGHDAAQDSSHCCAGDHLPAQPCPLSKLWHLIMPPPPPPPPPGGGMAPAPPPPPGGPQGMPGAFKIVPGLGDALHEAMRKISGVEEIAPAAEGLIIILLLWHWMPRVSLQ